MQIWRKKQHRRLLFPIRVDLRLAIKLRNYAQFILFLMRHAHTHTKHTQPFSLFSNTDAKDTCDCDMKNVQFFVLFWSIISRSTVYLFRATEAIGKMNRWYRWQETWPWTHKNTLLLPGIFKFLWLKNALQPTVLNSSYGCQTCLHLATQIGIIYKCVSRKGIPLFLSCSIVAGECPVCGRR